ncbi:MAG TPA: hypothetical protein VJA40_01200 [archaeon]|nr:hypothetical protein [archaeon]
MEEFEEFSHDALEAGQEHYHYHESVIRACAQCGFKNLELPPVVHYLNQVDRIVKSRKKHPEVILFCPRCGFGGAPLEFDGEHERSGFLKALKANKYKLITDSMRLRPSVDGVVALPEKLGAQKAKAHRVLRDVKAKPLKA